MRVRFLYFIFLAPFAGLVVVYIEMEIYESMFRCCAAFFLCSRPVVKGIKEAVYIIFCCVLLPARLLAEIHCVH